MLSWIPVLGPIISGITNVFSKYFDTKAVMYKTNGEVDIAAIQASTTLTANAQDRIAFRLAQDIILFPLCVWVSLVTWDNIVLHVRPDWVWTVERFPPGLEWLPYVAFGYLFGLGGLIAWGRK